MIRHVIMWKFKEEEQENMKKFLAGLQALDGVIPEIKRMEIGVNCKDGNNFDACLIADFEEPIIPELRNNPLTIPLL